MSNKPPSRTSLCALLPLSAVVLLSLLTSAAADCGCGPQCVNYSDASRCTRCCTATVKRSLLLSPPSSAVDGVVRHPRHYFLLPRKSDDVKSSSSSLSSSLRLRTPMWLQKTSSSTSLLHRRRSGRHDRHTRPERSVLSGLLAILDDSE